MEDQETYCASHVAAGHPDCKKIKSSFGGYLKNCSLKMLFQTDIIVGIIGIELKIANKAPANRTVPDNNSVITGR